MGRNNSDGGLKTPRLVGTLLRCGIAAIRADMGMDSSSRIGATIGFAEVAIPSCREALGRLLWCENPIKWQVSAASYPLPSCEARPRHTPDPLQGVKAHLDSVRLIGCRMVGLVLTGVYFNACVLERCNASFAQFRETRFKETRFKDCNLRGSSFQGADLRGASFVGCDTGEAPFRPEIGKGPGDRAFAFDQMYVVGGGFSPAASVLPYASWGPPERSPDLPWGWVGEAFPGWRSPRCWWLGSCTVRTWAPAFQVSGWVGPMGTSSRKGRQNLRSGAEKVAIHFHGGPFLLDGPGGVVNPWGSHAPGNPS